MPTWIRNAIQGFVFGVMLGIGLATSDKYHIALGATGLVTLAIDYLQA